MTTRFYGGDGTIHGSTEFDVETRDGKVVAVWFRCAALPFNQTEVDTERAEEMRSMYADGVMPRVHGLQLAGVDPHVIINEGHGTAVLSDPITGDTRERVAIIGTTSGTRDESDDVDFEAAHV